MKKNYWLAALLVLAVLAAVRLQHPFRRALYRTDAPRGEVRKLSLASAALGRTARYWVYLPPGFDASGATRYPALYLLHGLFRDEAAYVMGVEADLALEKLLAAGEARPMILVMPEGDSGFYVNAPGGGPQWESWIVDELRTEVERNFPVRTDRQGRGIGGFSMGGFGAMRLGLLHRDLYGSVSSQYGALRVEPVSVPWLGRKLRQAFGDDPAAYAAASPLNLIETTDLRDGQLAIYLDAGEEDAWALDEQAREFGRRLTARGVAHEFAIYPGNHTDSYLREHFPQVILFHARQMTP